MRHYVIICICARQQVFLFFANVDMQLTDSNYYPVLIKQISQFGSFLIDKEANLDRNLRFKEADVRNDVP